MRASFLEGDGVGRSRHLRRPLRADRRPPRQPAPRARAGCCPWRAASCRRPRTRPTRPPPRCGAAADLGDRASRRSSTRASAPDPSGSRRCATVATIVREAAAHLRGARPRSRTSALIGSLASARARDRRGPRRGPRRPGPHRDDERGPRRLLRGPERLPAARGQQRPDAERAGHVPVRRGAPRRGRAHGPRPDGVAREGPGRRAARRRSTPTSPPAGGGSTPTTTCATSGSRTASRSRLHTASQLWTALGHPAVDGVLAVDPHDAGGDHGGHRPGADAGGERSSDDVLEFILHDQYQGYLADGVRPLVHRRAARRARRDRPDGARRSSRRSTTSTRSSSTGSAPRPAGATC